jgi:hypothetical protein
LQLTVINAHLSVASAPGHGSFSELDRCAFDVFHDAGRDGRLKVLKIQFQVVSLHEGRGHVPNRHACQILQSPALSPTCGQIRIHLPRSPALAGTRVLDVDPDEQASVEVTAERESPQAACEAAQQPER